MLAEHTLACGVWQVDIAQTTDIVEFLPFQ